MSAATLTVAGLVALLAGAVYAYVGLKLARRPGPADARRALAYFATWWGALALNLVGVATTYFLAAAGALTLELQLVGSTLQRLLLCVSVFGLMEYFLVLLRGRSHATLLAIVYGALFVVLTYGMLAQRPESLFVGEWRTDLRYAAPDFPLVRVASLSLVLLPPVVASFAYLRLYWRVDDPMQRYRIALVSGALIVWWAIAVLAGQRALLDVGWMQLANRFGSLAAALVVLAAYLPPARVSRWLDARARPQA